MKKFISAKRSFLVFSTVLLLLGGLCCLFFKDDLLLSDNARFEHFTQKLFQEEVSSNTLNLHYTLAYPEKYGIKDYKISLGSMAPENLKKNTSSVKILLKKLERFSGAELSMENRMIYDMLHLDFSTQLSGSTLYMLQEPLGPNLGIQAQLPILLAEYTLRTSKDIKDYFSLLSETPHYFEEILAFEQEKSRQGLFMSDTSAERIIEQCSAFVQEADHHYLHSMFQQQLKDLLDAGQITQKQTVSYLNMHKKLLRECLFPAYQTLAQGLENLKGTGKNKNGLAQLPNGKAYYEYLIQNTTGDYRSVTEIEQNLYRQLLSDYARIQALQKEDPDIAAKAAAIPLTSSHSPEQILEFLRSIMTDDFPVLSMKDYQVKYVPKAMEKYSSPAFYLTPPIDTLAPNIIYINQSQPIPQSELFTTLAHEGFPGHLYQTLYFSSRDNKPIRYFLGCGGYVEGWATYVEELSYGYASAFLGIDSNIMDFLKLNRSVSLCLYSILDIGIHEKGWSLNTTADTLAAFGITDETACREIFQYIVENPANYLKYYLGYLNFCNLQQTVREMQGSNFQLKEFHRKLLEIGPAQFPIVKKYLLMQY